MKNRLITLVLAVTMAVAGAQLYADCSPQTNPDVNHDTALAQNRIWQWSDVENGTAVLKGKPGGDKNTINYIYVANLTDKKIIFRQYRWNKKGDKYTPFGPTEYKTYSDDPNGRGHIDTSDLDCQQMTSPLSLNPGEIMQVFHIRDDKKNFHHIIADYADDAPDRLKFGKVEGGDADAFQASYLRDSANMIGLAPMHEDWGKGAWVVFFPVPDQPSADYIVPYTDRKDKYDWNLIPGKDQETVTDSSGNSTPLNYPDGLPKYEGKLNARSYVASDSGVLNFIKELRQGMMSYNAEKQNDVRFNVYLTDAEYAAAYPATIQPTTSVGAATGVGCTFSQSYKDNHQKAVNAGKVTTWYNVMQGKPASEIDGFHTNVVNWTDRPIVFRQYLWDKKSNTYLPYKADNYDNYTKKNYFMYGHTASPYECSQIMSPQYLLPGEVMNVFHVPDFQHGFHSIVMDYETAGQGQTTGGLVSLLQDEGAKIPASTIWDADTGGMSNVLEANAGSWVVIYGASKSDFKTWATSGPDKDKMDTVRDGFTDIRVGQTQGYTLKGFKLDTRTGHFILDDHGQKIPVTRSIEGKLNGLGGNVGRRNVNTVEDLISNLQAAYDAINNYYMDNSDQQAFATIVQYQDTGSLEWLTDDQIAQANADAEQALTALANQLGAIQNIDDMRSQAQEIAQNWITAPGQTTDTIVGHIKDELHDKVIVGQTAAPQPTSTPTPAPAPASSDQGNVQGSLFSTSASAGQQPAATVTPESQPVTQPTTPAVPTKIQPTVGSAAAPPYARKR